MYGLKWNERYVFRKRIKEDALPPLFILRAGPYNREGALDPPLAAINHLFPKIMEVSCFTFQSVHADPPHAPPLFFTIGAVPRSQGQKTNAPCRIPPLTLSIPFSPAARSRFIFLSRPCFYLLCLSVLPIWAISHTCPAHFYKLVRRTTITFCFFVLELGRDKNQEALIPYRRRSAVGK